MQGMNFGMDGPSVTGWWYNPQTGDKFNAIDTFFEDNNLLIKTADGRMLNYNQIQNYVQVEKPEMIPDTKPNKQGKQSDFDDVPPEVQAILEDPNAPAGANSLIIPDDDIYSGRKQAPAAELGNIYKNPEVQAPVARNTTDSDIINRALVNKAAPSIDAEVSWFNYPQREIEMLIDVMNISEDEIIQYYIDSMSVEDIVKTVKEKVREFIMNNLHPVTTSSGVGSATKETTKKTKTKLSK